MNRRQFALGASSVFASSGFAGEVWAQTPSAWRQLNTEPYRGKQDDISFVSPDIGWYGNGAGKLYRTGDGGETWSLLWERYIAGRVLVRQVYSPKASPGL